MNKFKSDRLKIYVQLTLVINNEYFYFFKAKCNQTWTWSPKWYKYYGFKLYNMHNTDQSMQIPFPAPRASDVNKNKKQEKNDDASCMDPEKCWGFQSEVKLLWSENMA